MKNRCTQQSDRNLELYVYAGGVCAQCAQERLSQHQVIGKPQSYEGHTLPALTKLVLLQEEQIVLDKNLGEEQRTVQRVCENQFATSLATLQPK